MPSDGQILSEIARNSPDAMSVTSSFCFCLVAPHTTTTTMDAIHANAPFEPKRPKFVQLSTCCHSLPRPLSRVLQMQMSNGIVALGCREPS